MSPLDSIRPLYPHALESKFIRPVRPPLLASELIVGAFIGSERDTLKTPTTGDLSLALFYKDYPAALISYAVTAGLDLQILQLQGVKSRKSYRVDSGVEVVSVFVQETNRVASAGSFSRIAMPSPARIEGIEGAKPDALSGIIAKYSALASALLLVWSQEEQLFVRDV